MKIHSIDLIDALQLLFCLNKNNALVNALMHLHQTKKTINTLAVTSLIKVSVDYLFIYIFIYFIIYLFLYLCIYLFIYLCIHLFICLFYSFFI